MSSKRKKEINKASLSEAQEKELELWKTAFYETLSVAFDNFVDEKFADTIVGKIYQEAVQQYIDVAENVFDAYQAEIIKVMLETNAGELADADMAAQ